MLVAYFSMEFGIHERLPIYSGGLGVLAGDHLKSASDLGIPLIGIGLLYDQGYFRQTLDGEGWQKELYLNANPDLLPIEQVFGADEGIPVEDVREFEQALDEAGVEHEVAIYDGAPHSFFDRKFEEFADASADAWDRVLAFVARQSS